MPDTRADLAVAVEAIVALGTRRGDLARAAGWNAGYLSEFLARDGKNPTTAKLASLIETLQVLAVAKGIGADGTDALQRVVERYGLAPVMLATPAAGPIAAASRNYVHRGQLEVLLRHAVTTPGTYALDGLPMSGVSSTLLLVESMLQARGVRTYRLSARNDLVTSERITRSHTGVLGALAAAVTGRDEHLELDFLRAQEALRDEFAMAAKGAAVLLDDMNDLDPKDLEALKSIMRDWATRRAAASRGFAGTTVWLAYTSDVRRVTTRSQLLADYMILEWFGSDDVHALADALAPFVELSGLVESGDAWARACARSALELFAGQPQLTHLYLWDRSRDGTTSAPAVLDWKPAGAYRRHLARLARTFVEQLPPGAVESVVERLVETGALDGQVSVAERQAIESLGIIRPDGRWTSRYYRTHFPDAVAGRVPGVE